MFMAGSRAGIEVSKDVTALVKGWLQREDDQKMKLPTPPRIKHWPERQGLGAEVLQETKIQQKRSALHAKIKRKLMNAKRKRSNFVGLSQQLSSSFAVVQPVEHKDSSSDEEECSKANTVLLSRKRSLTGISSIHSYNRKRKKTRTSSGVRTAVKLLNSAKHCNVMTVSNDDDGTLRNQILGCSRQKDCHVNKSLSQQKNTVKKNKKRLKNSKKGT